MPTSARPSTRRSAHAPDRLVPNGIDAAGDWLTTLAALRQEVLSSRPDLESVLQRVVDDATTLVAETARLRAELTAADEARRDAEGRYRALADNATDIVTVVGLDGVRRDVSPSIERVLGYAPSELIGVNVAGTIHPDDQAEVRAAFARAVAGIVETGSVEFRSRHKDGSWRWLEAVATRLPDGAAGGGLLITSRDVTRRKRIEEELRRRDERLRALVQHSSDAIMVVRADGSLAYVSPSIERLLGYNPDEFVDAVTNDLFHPDDLATVQRRIARELGCVLGQGYLFAPPLPADLIPGLLTLPLDAAPALVAAGRG